MPLVDDLLQAWPVLPLQALEQRQAILDLLQPLGGRVDPVRIGAEKECEILELPFDALAGIDVWSELRIDRGELTHPLPHAAEP